MAARIVATAEARVASFLNKRSSSENSSPFSTAQKVYKAGAKVSKYYDTVHKTLCGKECYRTFTDFSSSGKGLYPASRDFYQCVEKCETLAEKALQALI